METAHALRWRVLILCSLGMIANAISIQVLSPVSHRVQEALGIDYGGLGFLMGAISIPGICIALPSGIIADRRGVRPVLYIGFLGMIVGSLIFAVKPGYTLLCLARIITGAGCILLSVILPGVLTHYFDPKSVGMAMGLFNTALPVGSIFTLSTFGPFGQRVGPFGVFYIAAFAALAVFILFILLLPVLEKREAKENPAESESISTGSPIWILAFIVLFANMATMGYVTIGPAYFEIEKFSLALTGIMLSAVLWGTLILSPIAGFLTTRRHLGKIIIAAGCLLQGISLVLIPLRETPIALDLIVLAICGGVIMTPVYILVPKAIHGSQLNRGYGIIMSMMMVGCLTGPYFAGFSVDKCGGFSAGFMALGIFSILGAVCALLLKKNLIGSGASLQT